MAAATRQHLDSTNNYLLKLQVCKPADFRLKVTGFLRSIEILQLKRHCVQSMPRICPVPFKSSSAGLLQLICSQPDDTIV